MRPPAVHTDRRPFVLVWELTQACDLACKHCRAEANPERHPGELTTPEGRRLLEEVREFGDGQLVVLSGGDPLYRDDTIDLIRYGIDLGLNMTLTPSGTSSLTPAVIRELRATGLRRLALSLDGATPEAHDAFRQEQGSFHTTVQAAREARSVGLPLQINTTVCAETVDDLSAMHDLVESLDAVLWSVFFLVPVGRGTTLEPITPDRAESIMAWLAEVEATSDVAIKTTEAPHFRRVRLQHTGVGQDDARGNRGIIAGDGFVFVSHLGDVYPSGFLPVSVGNVRESSIVDIYREAPLLNRLRDRDALTGKCGACPFRHVCGGSRSRAFAYTGDPLAADRLCSYIPEGFDGEPPKQGFQSVG